LIVGSKEEALHIACSNVNHLLKAKSHLTAKGYLTPGLDISSLGLSLILFQIVADAKAPLLSDNIKAVAFLLEAITIDAISDRIVDSVDLKLKSSLDSWTTSSDRLDDQQQELAENTAALVNAGMQLLENNKKLSQSLDDVTGSLRDRVALDSVGLGEGGSMPSINGPSPVTYAAVSQCFLPPSHASVLAKHDERTRQIIIQPVPDAPETQSLSSLLELELITKAMLAFNYVDQGVSPAPPNLRFVGTKKLAAGGVILDLNSADAASWLKGSVICQAFMQHFSAMSSMRDLEFRVLAKSHPSTSCTPEAVL
jgi:hypothetical protein